MPSEFLDSYNEDRPTGEAVLDRTPNKVYVSNKISSEEVLTEFLINLEKGISPSWQGLLAVHELEPIVKEVEFANPVLKEILALIHANFLALRFKKEKDTRKASQMDAREFPDYYVSATSSASDRTVNKLIDQLKARFVIHQMMNGVDFKDLRTTIEMKDLGLFFEGLGYWAPQKIDSIMQDGMPQFKNNSLVMESLIGSGVVDSRVKSHLEMMLEEARDYVSVLNEITSDFMQEYKKEITKYPELFPGSKNTDKMIHDLSALKLNLELRKAHGDKSLVLTALLSDYSRKEASLIEYLENNNIMSKAELIEKIKENIQTLQKQKKVEPKEVRDEKKEDEERKRKEQNEKIKQSVIDGSRAIFHQIEPGSFKMGEVGSQIDVTITKPFDMMATQTTQVIWKTVAELARTKLVKKGMLGFGTVTPKYEIKADPSNWKGDLLPVEYVSYKKIQIWIRALNELSEIGEPALADLIPGHKKGDKYRLPTEAEWEFVVRGRGAYNDTYHFGNNAADLGEYAWFNGNSGSKTHTVAKKKPLVIGGKEFYDLHGNVWEWVNDWFHSSLPGGVDPQGPVAGSERVVRGGSWGSFADGLRSAFRGHFSPGDRYELIGFRLVRTAK